MRILSLLKASLVAALLFALSWVRMPLSLTHLGFIVRIFLGYGLLILLLSLLVGAPVVLIIDKLRIGRWWSYTGIAATIGAVLPAILVPYRQTGDVFNPFCLVFSPWTRNSPGFVGSIPASPLDYVGSISFGTIVGGALGITFWYFYSRSARPNNRFQRSRGASSVSQGGSR
jgi:hypothetical protein